MYTFVSFDKDVTDLDMNVFNFRLHTKYIVFVIFTSKFFLDHHYIHYVCTIALYKIRRKYILFIMSQAFGIFLYQFVGFYN